MQKIKKIALKALTNYRVGRNTPILIYQMGKVGSMSIYRSLKKQYNGLVLHIHNIDHQLDVKADLSTYWKLYKRNPEQEVFIISLVREPISRNISDFFQNFKFYVGVEPQYYKGDVHQLINIFIEKFPHRAMLNWFEINLHKHFGIDVFANNFPSSGHTTVLHENAKLLLMKHDLADSDKQKLIEDHVGINNFKIFNENVASEKPYGEIYKEFLKEVKIPTHVLDEISESLYFKHFYGSRSEEILEKWK